MWYLLFLPIESWRMNRALVYKVRDREEEEAELEKLAAWHEKITARDLFHASHAEDDAAKCR